VIEPKAKIMKQHKEEYGVLIVEDDPLVLKYTAAAVETIGYQNVETANCAAEARVKLFAQRFALVICDIYLPDGDGRQLLREVFAMTPNVRAILISGFMYRGIMIPSDLNGKVELLEKPFTAEDIQELLAEARHVARRS
jgi:two-component system response regulator HydG